MADNKKRKKESTLKWTFEEENIVKYPCLDDTKVKSYKERNKYHIIDEPASIVPHTGHCWPDALCNVGCRSGHLSAASTSQLMCGGYIYNVHEMAGIYGLICITVYVCWVMI